MNNTHVFGLHAVRSVLANNPRSVVRLMLSDSRRDKPLLALESLAKEQRVSVESVSQKQLQKNFPDARHQGAVAECKPREVMSEPQLLKLVMSLDKPLLLVLDGVTDPHNLGAVLRTADAAGVDAVLVPRNGSAGLTPVVRKVASGAAETIAFCPVANLARSLAELKEMGVWIYGASDAADSDYTSIDYKGPIAIVMGAEGKGLRRLTREACDGLISIPMAGSVSSLNVSVATGICLFEAVRQRRE